MKFLFEVEGKGANGLRVCRRRFERGILAEFLDCQRAVLEEFVRNDRQIEQRRAVIRPLLERAAEIFRRFIRVAALEPD